VLAHPLSPNLVTISRILTSIYLGVRFVLSLAANLKLSIGEKVSRSTSSCWTKAPSLPKSLFIILRSLQRTSPVIFEPGLRPSRWPSTLRNEVFPHPLDPITAINWPGLANPVRPCRIYFLFLPPKVDGGSSVLGIALTILLVSLYVAVILAESRVIFMFL